MKFHLARQRKIDNTTWIHRIYEHENHEQSKNEIIKLNAFHMIRLDLFLLILLYLLFSQV